MLRENDVIQSEKVYKVCWDINPHHFSVKDKDSDASGTRRAYEGFAEEEATYTAEEWAEAMVIFIGIMEQFSSFLRPGMKVLDIGSGTGYNTAALAHLVGPTGLVVAVEQSDEMIKHAESVLKRHHPDLLQRIQFVKADGMKGYASGAPFDAIHVEGAVRGTIRKNWIEQLRDGGILLGPFIQNDEEAGHEVQMLRMMRKIEGTTFEQVDLMEVDFEELTSSDPTPGAHQAPRRPKTSILDREQLEFEEVQEETESKPSDKPYQ
jgi:protein-L-isoaspartate(D-aspartate) O-methyltransferase